MIKAKTYWINSTATNKCYKIGSPLPFNLLIAISDWSLQRGPPVRLNVFSVSNSSERSNEKVTEKVKFSKKGWEIFYSLMSLKKISESES
jgi:hypothetical protein